MVDNVQITAGTGTVISTDDAGASGHVQRVKLTYSADGDATHISADASGLLVNLGTNNDVTNLGTFAVQVDGSALTALQLIDDPVQVLGTDTYVEGTSKGVTLGAVRRDADTTLVNTTNEFGPLQMDANGRLKVEVFSGETLPVSLSSTTITSISTGDNNIGNVDVLTAPGTAAEAAALPGVFVVVAGDDGTDTQPLQLNANGDLKVSLDSESVAVTGTFWQTTQPVSGTVTVGSITAGDNNIGNVDVVTMPGSATHDVGEPSVGLYGMMSATTGLSGITLVANDDATHLHAGVDGVQITRPYSCHEDIVSGRASNTDGASFQVIAAGAAGVKHYITTIILVNTSTSAIFCDILDGASIKATVPVPAQGGATVNLPVPIPGTAATAWNCDPSAATTTVYCTLVGYKSKV